MRFVLPSWHAEQGTLLLADWTKVPSLSSCRCWEGCSLPLTHHFAAVPDVALCKAAMEGYLLLFGRSVVAMLGTYQLPRRDSFINLDGQKTFGLYTA